MKTISRNPEGRPVPAPEVERRLTALMDEYEARIYAYVLGLVQDADVAQDCVQETFIRAYDLLRRGRDVNKQWVYKVARSRAIDHFRRQRRVRSDDGLELQAVEGPADEAIDVRGTLDRLPASDREVLALSAVSGFTSEEIGAMLDCTGAAVRQRLVRARARFRQAYDQAA